MTAACFTNRRQGGARLHDYCGCEARQATKEEAREGMGRSSKFYERLKQMATKNNGSSGTSEVIEPPKRADLTFKWLARRGKGCNLCSTTSAARHRQRPITKTLKSPRHASQKSRRRRRPKVDDFDAPKTQLTASKHTHNC